MKKPALGGFLSGSDESLQVQRLMLGGSRLSKKSFLPGMLTNDGYRASRFAQLNGSHDL